ncbi:MAG: heme o synthase [Chloroflexota bacterium]|nr:heme o synthase [Chloroflexota bacterium]
MANLISESTAIAKDYITLGKPKIVSLLLFTALAGMLLASEGYPDLSLTILVMIGGTLASSGANALNQFFDQDIDSKMTRTKDRPIAASRVKPSHAMIYGIGLNLLSFAVFTIYVNWISAILTMSATLFYIFVYTLALKRHTTQNIVIGGAAGSLPPMIGWSAVTGDISLAAVYMFAIIFFWTPPHFWALSLILKDDYAKAKVPMLPVVVGVEQTKKSIFLYTLILLALTSMFFTSGSVGWIYFISAIVLGMGFTYFAFKLWRTNGIDHALGTYLYSLGYLFALFGAIMIDVIL